MKKSFFAAAAFFAVGAFPLAASAADAPKPDWTFTGNAGLFSDYRFRGFTQTAYRPAFQGGFDFAHKSGFYLGNWNSNVEQALYRGASLEMDFYGGYKMDMGPLLLDFGGQYYYYPSGNAQGLGQVDQGELYVAATYSLGAAAVIGKFSYGLTNFFGLGDGTATDSKGNWYLDLGGTYDLGEGWGVNAHYGHQYVKNGETLGLKKDSVDDYKLGVTKDLSGWILAGTFVGTSKKDYFTTGVSAPEAGGKTSVVVSVSKTF
jgi:uncharacterized protein (TIGR02001 family)